MPAPKRDEAREERITMEIVVDCYLDCYNEHEAWSGRWCQLADKRAFPFQAECIRVWRGSLLKVGERATVTEMLGDDEAADSLPEMLVMVARQDRTFGVPLAQHVGRDVNEITAQAIAGWHYRVAQGRQF